MNHRPDQNANYALAPVSVASLPASVLPKTCIFRRPPVQEVNLHYNIELSPFLWDRKPELEEVFKSFP